MLLIDGNKTEPVEFDIVFDQRVRADDQLGFAGADSLQRGSFLGRLQAADEQFNRVAAQARGCGARKDSAVRQEFP